MGPPLVLTPLLLHSVLVVGTADELIWRLCFSSDGKLLATAGKEGVIRVSSGTFILVIVIAVITLFEANAQHSATFGALDLGYRQGANPRQVRGSHLGDLLAYFLVGREIPCFWVC